MPFFNPTNFNQGFRGIAFVPNQSPTLTGANSNLPALFENPATNPGELVTAVIAGLGGNAITDTAGSHQGIAVTAADQANGTWQLSTNGGGSWHDMPAVTESAALTLASDGSTRIRFVPHTNYNGNTTISFRAWDQRRAPMAARSTSRIC